MGVGHVSPGAVPRACPSAHFQGRERRGVGEGRAVTLSNPRNDLGAIGERLAAWFLAEQGLEILAVNVPVGDGEIDLLTTDHGKRVVVEVRAVTGGGDPIDAIGDSKRRRVTFLAAVAGAQRVDLVGIGVSAAGIDVHWLPGVN